MSILEEILLRFGGHGVITVSDNGVACDHPKVVEYLRLHGTRFNTLGLELKPGQPRRCHTNVCDLIGLTDIKIAHGYALGTDGLWECHSWGFQDGHIVETCPVNGEGRAQYYGFFEDWQSFD